MTLADRLRNIRAHLQSGRFGQREAWVEQLDLAAAALDAVTGDTVILLPVKLKGETGPGSGRFWIEIEGVMGYVAVPAAQLVHAHLLKSTPLAKSEPS